MTTQDSRGSAPASRRLTIKSLRLALAIGGVALSVLGLSQVTGTSAAWQDLNNSATSGSLTIASNVLPAVTFSNVKNSGTGGTQWCDLTWPHLGYPYKYRTEVYLNNTGSPVWAEDQDPGVNAPAGTSITRGVGSSETEYHFTQTRLFTARVYTINRLTLEKSTDWRGQEIRRRAAFYEGTCNGDRQSISGANLTIDSDPLNARLAAPAETTTAAPSSATSATAPSSSTTAPTTSSTTAPTTSSTTPSPSPSPTTTTTTTTTTTRDAPVTTNPTTTVSSLPTSTTTTATASATPLAPSRTSRSGRYSAALVMTSGTSQTEVVIEDSNGGELKRIPASASARYEWDSSTDALWILDSGQLYKATGSSWSKTAVDPSSSDVPAEIAALVE